MRALYRRAPSGAGDVVSPPPFPFTSRSTPMRKLLATCRRLDDHWVGDLIGVLFLFAFGYAAVFLGFVLEGGR